MSIKWDDASPAQALVEAAVAGIIVAKIIRSQDMKVSHKTQPSNSWGNFSQKMAM